ncbi:hypothetical protein [Brachybacterium sp.]|uniref:hypothetical protein n=1 Tax=Brachybacterium sp. TaxID=1891286 RepID=UPI002ED420F9
MSAPLPDEPVGGPATALSPAQHRTLAGTALALPGRAEQVLARPTHRALGRVVRDAVLFLLPGHPAHEVPPEQLVAAAVEALTGLRALQLPSGTFSGGDNVDSPPDTAFTINDLAWARTALAAGADASAGHELLLAGLDPLLEAVTSALVQGGVHTPNHRWEIASALCRLWEALGEPAARERAEQWLAEGVDLQADGLFSERSANYAAHVSVPSLLTTGRILERPELVAAADAATRRQADLTDAAGLVETLASRRQDQFERFDGGALHPWFRAHAARAQDPLTARAARRTAERADADALLTLLAHGREDPRALGALPAPAPDPTADRPEVVELSVSGLVRADHGTSSTVLYGGTDTAQLGRITSGTSSQPVLARFLGRSAGVRELRLSRDFFSLGPLRPGAPVPAEAADGALRYLLEEEVGGEYFQPLPPAERDPDGAYALEFNGRFAAAMGFSRRPVETVSLRTTMEATLRADELALRWDFVGPTTAVCLLLALDGLRPGADLRQEAQGRHVLEPADGAHRARCVLRGTEERLEIEVEGGLGGRAFYDPGEAYSFLGASDEPAGDVLLIPASTAAPLQLTLRIAPVR